jgi:pimeloyl-[acyl-carrier protein] methyl ester esterase
MTTGAANADRAGHQPPEPADPPAPGDADSGASRAAAGESGGAIVLIHGWGMHGGIWRELLPGLGGYEPRLTPDLPGHGGAPCTDGPYGLDEITDALAPAVPHDATVLGWSLGAMVALNLARRHGRRVGRLVLVSATPRFTNTDDWDRGIADGVFDLFARTLSSDYRQTLSRFLSLQVRGSDTSRSTLRLLRSVLFARGEPQQAALAGGLEILRRADLRGWLGEIRQPAHVIAGLRDRLVPAAASRALAAALPAGRFTALPEAGHAPFVSHRDQFLAALSAPAAAAETPA